MNNYEAQRHYPTRPGLAAYSSVSHLQSEQRGPILSARGIHKSFDSAVALNAVDLDVYTGESLAIMGPSGSGKSTLMHVLAGVLRPDAGTVLFQADSTEALDVASLNEKTRSLIRRTRFGFVFQQGLLLPELTAVQNVALPLMLSNVSRREAEERAAQWLATLGLAGFENRLIGQLSGGQAQRVAIARAQVTGAPVIFTDEPTGALDSRTSSEVMDILLATTSEQDKALVVVTHDSAVSRRCTRVVHLLDGYASESPVLARSFGA